jgi:hypothetical protein
MFELLLCIVIVVWLNKAANKSIAISQTIIDVNNAQIKIYNEQTAMYNAEIEAIYAARRARGEV